MTVQRKRSASNIGLEAAVADSSIETNKSGSLSKKIRRCDSSADAASLLLLLSKQSAGESTSQGNSPALSQQQAKHANMENFPALLPPPRFNFFHFTNYQGGSDDHEVNNNDVMIRLQPLDVCLLNYNSHTDGASFKERRPPQSRRSPHAQSVIGTPMAPAPRLPKMSAGGAFEPSH